MDKIFDCVIIGSGPSGLSAANILSEAGIDFLIIEKGDFLYKRNRDKEVDIVTGIGGGGLYSDGKISFYPSGSKLYLLEQVLLQKSYQYVVNIFKIFSIEIPEFNIDWLQMGKDTHLDPSINKNYKSIVLAQDQLFNLGFFLYDQIGTDKFLLKHSVTNITYTNNIFKIEVQNDNNLKFIKSRNILFCGGKFGSELYPKVLEDKNLIFKKYEFGFRIETNINDFDYKDIPQTDLKLVFKDTNVNIEFRTFCFCRNGYIVKGKFENFYSLNGISNKSNSHQTNFGFNLRINDEKFYKKYATKLKDLKILGFIIDQPLIDFLTLKESNFFKDFHLLFKNCLLKYFPILSKSKAKIIGPSFEYVGYYPKLNEELKIGNQNFWVAGDATGDFRGLIPSLVSGAIAANSLLKKERKDRDSLYELVRIKSSPTTKTKTIFTAQSKKFFYAKDVICEYVFNEGHIPINPFQVFGYFLGDRVDRSLVRNGNNELITRCDELWVFGPIADGVLFEIARAYELKISIRFFTIGSKISEITEITDISKLVFEPEVYAQIGKENLISFISKYYVEDDKKINQLRFGFEDVD